MPELTREQIMSAWQRLKDHCCADPSKANRCVMVSESDFFFALENISTLVSYKALLTGPHALASTCPPPASAEVAALVKRLRDYGKGFGVRSLAIADAIVMLERLNARR